MSDVPRPLKQLMPIYRQTESELLDVIYEKFLGQPLTVEETRLLKEIDNVFLWYDLTYLLQDKPDSAPPQVYCVPDYRPRLFADVEAEYLQCYRQCQEGKSWK